MKNRRKYWVVVCILIPLSLMIIAQAQDRRAISNPNIDMRGYLDVASEAARHREPRRVTEEEFIKMSQEPGTIILDARSKQLFDLLHIKGAINLSFPDIAVESLKTTIPDKCTRILIYCNNNFRGAERPFPTKSITASLNLSTYIALYNYGYRNIYELGPLIDFDRSRLEFESSPAVKQ
ncbi:MAG: rhodanese-like domain-containing protein [Acidobacteria bacterium]|nr:rhodanese-like domain-containing protein [Acidobacteriota bacterium]